MCLISICSRLPTTRWGPKTTKQNYIKRDWSNHVVWNVLNKFLLCSLCFFASMTAFLTFTWNLIRQCLPWENPLKEEIDENANFQSLAICRWGFFTIESYVTFFFFVAVAWYVISDSLRKKRGECCMWLFCESLSLETLSILAAKKSSLWIELDFIFVDCKLCQFKSVGIHLV